MGTQVQEGYFADCPITFLNIQEVKDVLKAKLRTIYHTRIQYPEMEAQAKATASTENE